MAFQIQKGDKVTITIYPPKPPGPPKPNMPPVVALLTRDDGSFQVFTAQNLPELRGFERLYVKPIKTLEGAVASTISEPEPEPEEATEEGCGDGKPRKYTKREALIIQSQTLSIASQAISLQSEAIQAQLDALDKAESDKEV